MVLACGPWVDPLARTAGFELGITPERSQIAFFRRPGAARRHPVVIDGVLGTYFRPHGGELSLLGVEAGHHIEVEAIDREIEGYDHAVVAPALGRLAGRVPSFAGAPFARGHRGVYDTSADSRAVLDAAPGVAGLFVAGGFSGTGFKKSPAVGACMAELVTQGEATTVDLHPFRLAGSPTATRSSGTSTACRRSSATGSSGNRSAWAGSDQSAGLAIYTP